MSSVRARANWIWKRISESQKTYTFFLASLCVLVFFSMSFLCPRTFPTQRNLASMAFQFPELGLFSLAIALSLISGGIDLSVVSTANLAAVLAGLAAGKLFPSQESQFYSTCAVVFIALSTGFICGSINSFLIAFLRISPILATLGTMQLYFGIALALTGGTAVFGFPRAFLFLGNGTIGGIPMPSFVFAFVVLLLWILLHRTTLGLKIFFLGENPKATKLSGISVGETIFLTYIISGLLCGLTGLIIAARTNSAKADYGSSYLLQAVLIAVLGGVSPTGGKGTVVGVVIAVITLQFLTSGLNMLRVSTYAAQASWGGLLLAVMTGAFLLKAKVK